MKELLNNERSTLDDDINDIFSVVAKVLSHSSLPAAVYYTTLLLLLIILHFILPFLCTTY